MVGVFQYSLGGGRTVAGATTTVTAKSYFSSASSSGTKQTGFQLDALPFSIAPEKALLSFQAWVEQDQGLRYLMNYSSVRIGAAYVPVWSFDMNVRFKVTTSKGGGGAGPRTVDYRWKPGFFSVYGPQQSIIHIPGLSAYAGYSYRRSLINPIHSTTLVFMGDRTERFGGWMLQDMKLQSTGGIIPVVPDAWNATKGRAFTIVRDELEAVAQLEFAALQKQQQQEGSQATTIESQLDVQTELVRARRVMMPTYVIDYSIFGLEYRAFVSGCDEGAAVAGVSHLILGPSSSSAASSNFVSQMIDQSSAILRVDRLPTVLRFLGFFRPLWSMILLLLTRVFFLIPVLGVAGGALAGFRKILQPWMDSKSASAEWERQREHEALMFEQAQQKRTTVSHQEEVSRMNDFTDTLGTAQSYFSQNRQQILRQLSGETAHAHHEGTYDWYKDWQEWARKQWEQQQQRQEPFQQQQQTRTTRQKPKPDFVWGFDENDPYSVLGIRRGATKAQVSAAFRTEMLKHHPDTQPNATEAQKLRAVERSKIISDAYRKIKAEMK
jgi:hypothetical protein